MRRNFPSFLAVIAVLGLLTLSRFEAFAVPNGGPQSSNPGSSQVQNSKSLERLSNPPGANLAVVITPEPATGILLGIGLIALVLIQILRRRLVDDRAGERNNHD